MRKVLFTESQFRKILINEGLATGLDKGGGYIVQGDGSQPPANASGNQVFVDPTNNTKNDGKEKVKDKAVKSDDFEASMNKDKSYWGPRSGKATGPAMTENIEKQKSGHSPVQRAMALASGTEVGEHIAQEETTTNGRDRKRKFDFKKKMENDPEGFKQKYSNIAPIVQSALNQMSIKNDAETNNSDTSKLTVTNDVTKVKTSVSNGKSHHKDGEKLNNGSTVHYYN